MLVKKYVTFTAKKWYYPFFWLCNSTCVQIFSGTAGTAYAGFQNGTIFFWMITTLLTKPFLHLTYFGVLEKDSLCMKRVRSFLRMRCLLLRCSFEPRTNSRALGTEGSLMTIGLSINGSLALRKPVWLAILEVRASVTSRASRDWGRACFPPPHSRRQKEVSLDQNTTTNELRK